MSHKLIQAFELQSRHCADLGSPFMARMCKISALLLTPEGDVANALFNWAGDVAPGGHNLPLRLMGALHNLVITGQCQPLSDIFPPHYKDKTDAQIWAGVSAAFETHAVFILGFLQSPPQTNEVRRSAILLPGFLSIAKATNGLPFVLSEIGASAGLNLNWNQYYYQFGDKEWGDKNATVKLCPKWSGPVPKLKNIVVQERRGCDLMPTDLTDKTETTNLLSYLWADQGERITHTEYAFETASLYPYHVDKMDAIEWLKQRLSQRYEGAVHVIYHTIAWQYFPQNLKREGRALIKDAGAMASETAPLAWLVFEADGQEPG
ncbi:MAG: DUF2332 family protein, partial [Robiginitomaculum sp.]|nr:DUF2332 family protein [Robiginitomaculum sp.]